MSTYLLIESRDAFDSKDVAAYCDLAMQLTHGGHNVVLFLVQNGVFMARADAQTQLLQKAVSNGVVVLAEEFSLRERGVSLQGLAEGVECSPLDRVVEEMAKGVNVIWH